MDDAVGADAASEPHREPAAARADVRDLRAIGNAELVHHLLGLLPLVAIRAFEQAQFLRLEEWCVSGLLLRRGRRQRKSQQDNHRQPCDNTSTSHFHTLLMPS